VKRTRDSGASTEGCKMIAKFSRKAVVLGVAAP
jgi:hypothetical protein